MDAQLLSYSRESVENEFASTCTILGKSGASDGAGGSSATWATVTTYPCDLQAPTPAARELISGEQLRSKVTLICHLPWDAVVTPQNRIQVGSTVLEVLDTNAGTSDRLGLEAYCRRVGG